MLTGIYPGSFDPVTYGHLDIIKRSAEMVDELVVGVLAQTNHKLASDVETIFLTTNLQYSYLSSTTVKEVAAFGGDISQFVPDYIEQKVWGKMKHKRRV